MDDFLRPPPKPANRKSVVRRSAGLRWRKPALVQTGYFLTGVQAVEKRRNVIKMETRRPLFETGNGGLWRGHIDPIRPEADNRRRCTQQRSPSTAEA